MKELYFWFSAVEQDRQAVKEIENKINFLVASKIVMDLSYCRGSFYSASIW